MQYLTLAEVSRILKKAPQTIDRWVNEGRMIADAYAKNKPLFTQATVDAMINELKVYDSPGLKRQKEENQNMLLTVT